VAEQLKERLDYEKRKTQSLSTLWLRKKKILNF
jgi:hypothetical protein